MKTWKVSTTDGTYSYEVQQAETAQTVNWVRTYRKAGKDEDVEESFVGYVALYGAGNSDGPEKGMMLYQELTTREIRETGVNRDQWIYLTGTTDDRRTCEERTRPAE